MHLATVRFGFSTLLLVSLLGCVPGPEPAKPKDAGGMETGGGVTYTKDVQPILQAKCAPCHTADGQGHHNIATSYADAFKKVSSTMYDDCYTGTLAMPVFKTVGECAAILVRKGLMPYAMGCDQTPPPEPAVCVGVADQDTIAAWVAAGMPQ